MIGFYKRMSVSFQELKSWFGKQKYSFQISMRKIFDTILDPTHTDKNLGLFKLFAAAAMMVIVTFSVFCILQLLFWAFGKDPFEKLGQTGDFFGGILNPLLTFLAFIGVLATIFLQREELKSTREEISRQANALETQLHAIAKQNFEATLFQMLSLHNSNVNELRALDDAGKPISGRFVFSKYAKDLSGTYGNGYAQGFDPSDLDIWPKVYINFWDQHRDALGHYFRLLYNMIRFVDQKMPGAINDTDRSERMGYIRIIRAQLSDAELVNIFYNCFSEHGGGFLDYAKYYDLFDNLDENLLFNGTHRAKLRELKGEKQMLDWT